MFIFGGVVSSGKFPKLFQTALQGTGREQLCAQDLAFEVGCAAQRICGDVFMK